MNGTLTKSRRPARKKGGDDVREVLDSIRRLVRALRLGSRQAERQVGLTGAQLFVLQKLAESGADVLSVNDLADLTHTHQSSVSVVAQLLVDKGLLTKTRAADDARRLELSLTSNARSLLKKAPGAAQDRLVSALKRLPSGTRNQLGKGLERLVQEAGLGDEEPHMIFDELDERTRRAIVRARARAAKRAAMGRW